MALLSGFDQLDQTADTFSDWLNKTNELILLTRGDATGAQTSFMTANSLPGGSMTYGNATLFGQMAANQMVIFAEGLAPSSNAYANGFYGGLRGGNWVDASNTIVTDTLYITSNTTVTDESVEVYINSTYGLIVENNIEARYDVLYVGDGPAGTNTNPQLHWQSSNNQLNFNNDVRATFGLASGTEIFGGTGQMELYYSSGRMYANTDNLDIRANTDVNFITDNFELKSDNGSELYISADVADNSTVKLYYEGNERLSTNTHGIVVNGDTIIQDDIVMFDNGRIMMGGAYPYDGTQDLATYNFQIWTDGSDGYVRSGDRDLLLQAETATRIQNELGTRNYFTANTLGEQEVTLYANNIERLQTVDGTLGSNSVNGVEIYGEANTTTLRVQEDANFDGVGGLNSNNVHWDASANTWNYRDATKLTLGDSDDWEMFYLAAGRAYSNTDNMDIRARTDMNMITDIFELKSETGSELYLTANVNNGVELYWDNTKKLSTNTNGIEVYGQVLANAGFVTYNNQPIEMGGADYAAAHNFTIVTDGTDTTITETTNDLSIRVEDNFRVTDDTGTISLIVANTAGEVTLYHNNTAKLQTNTTGIEVYGEANTETARILGDANFDGSGGLNSNNVSWDASANTWNYRDDTRARFGDGFDLQIWHDSTTGHSFIMEQGPGSLYIEGTNLIMRATDDTVYMDGTDGGSVRLYYAGDGANNVARITTTNIGINIEGEANTDTLRVQSTSDFEGNINIQGSTNADTVTWTKSSNTLNFDDNNYATFGTGGDLTITHDGSDSTIWEQTGSINIYTSANNEDITLRSDDSAGGVTDYLRADGSEGKLRLYYYGAQKLETNNGGVTVTGNTVADGFVAGDNEKLQLGNSQDLELYHNATNSVVENNTGALVIQNNANDNDVVIKSDDGANNLADYFRADGSTGEVILAHYGSQKLRTKVDGVWIEGQANTDTLRVQSTSDLEGNINVQGSTNADTLTWTKSANTLNFDDNNFAKFGTDGDLSIYHDGSHSYIRDQGTGRLYATSDNFRVTNAQGNETMIDAVANGSVSLWYDNAEKLETTTTGVTVTGTVIADGVTVGDDEIIQLGSAMQLEANSSIAIIRESTNGSLFVQSNNLIMEDTDGNDYITGIAGGTTRLYHAGAYKLETDALGVNVNGQLDISSNLTVDGSTSLKGTVDLGDATSDNIDFNGRVRTDIDPNANNARDLGSDALRWNNLWIGGTATIDVLTAEGNSVFEDSVDIQDSLTVTNTVTALDFIGSGDQITDLDANNINAGTIDDAYLPNSISSDITGNAATATKPAITDSSTDIDFRVVFAANTGTHRDLYADSTMLFNPADDTLIVENLIVNDQTTLTANITFGNVTSFENIEVANTATILNLEVTSLEANGVAFTGTGDDVITTTPTIIDTFPVTQTQGFKFFVHGENLNDADSGYAVEINVIATDNLDIYYTRYGEVESNMTDVTIVPTLAANNTHIDLLATCLSASGTNIHRFKVLKIETRP